MRGCRRIGGSLALQIDFDNLAQVLTLPSALDGVVAQLVERLNGIQEVRGSSPLGSTILSSAVIAALLPS